MQYEAKDFSGLTGTPGFSEQLLRNHFTLYQGYVTNTNGLADALAAMLKDGRAGTPEYAELKRRFGWEFNGMRLHELCFGSMAKGGTAPDKGSAFFKAIAKDFGGFDEWAKDFKATGSMRGIGWAVLYFDRHAPTGSGQVSGGRLFNAWVNEHDAGHLTGAAPLLVMDVFEHAFITDYGLKRAEYIEAFFRAIDWTAVSRRFAEATK